jgi:hypothetical protein
MNEMVQQTNSGQSTGHVYKGVCDWRLPFVGERGDRRMCNWRLPFVGERGDCQVGLVYGGLMLNRPSNRWVVNKKKNTLSSGVGVRDQSPELKKFNLPPRVLSFENAIFEFPNLISPLPLDNFCPFWVCHVWLFCMRGIALLFLPLFVMTFKLANVQLSNSNQVSIYLSYTMSLALYIYILIVQIDIDSPCCYGGCLIPRYPVCG